MAKECSTDYEKVRTRWFFKEPLTEWFFVEPKMVLLWHHCEEPFEAPLFLRVYTWKVITFMDTRGVTIHLAESKYEMRQNPDTWFTRTRQYLNTIFKTFSMTKYLSFNHKKIKTLSSAKQCSCILKYFN